MKFHRSRICISSTKEAIRFLRDQHFSSCPPTSDPASMEEERKGEEPHREESRFVQQEEVGIRHRDARRTRQEGSTYFCLQDGTIIIIIIMTSQPPAPELLLETTRTGFQTWEHPHSYG